jgi:hypothetical protein
MPWHNFQAFCASRTCVLGTFAFSWNMVVSFIMPKVIYLVSNTTFIINIINLATCFSSLNFPHAISYNKVKVHSASAHIMGSHTVYRSHWH